MGRSYHEQTMDANAELNVRKAAGWDLDYYSHMHASFQFIALIVHNVCWKI